MFCANGTKWCDVCPLRRKAKLHSRSEHHCRRQHRLPARANIVPKQKALLSQCFLFWRYRPDLNWRMRVLQTLALPLGHGTIWNKERMVTFLAFWSGWRGSNSLPPPWQGGALPDELHPQVWCLRSESNQRHADFQSAALPTELQRHMRKLPSSIRKTCDMATPNGLEPSTSSVTGWRANRLHHRAVFGGNNRARTCDPLLVRQMLSQLSYAPMRRMLFTSATWFIIHKKPIFVKHFFIFFQKNYSCRKGSIFPPYSVIYQISSSNFLMSSVVNS